MNGGHPSSSGSATKERILEGWCHSTWAAWEQSSAQLNVNQAQPSRRLQSTALTCYDSPDILRDCCSTAPARAVTSAVFLDMLWYCHYNINMCHLWSTVKLYNAAMGASANTFTQPLKTWSHFLLCLPLRTCQTTLTLPLWYFMLRLEMLWKTVSYRPTALHKVGVDSISCV